MGGEPDLGVSGLLLDLGGNGGLLGSAGPALLGLTARSKSTRSERRVTTGREKKKKRGDEPDGGLASLLTLLGLHVALLVDDIKGGTNNGTDGLALDSALLLLCVIDTSLLVGASVDLGPGDLSGVALPEELRLALGVEEDEALRHKEKKKKEKKGR